MAPPGKALAITQGELLERLAREAPDRDALVYPKRGLRLSFADLEVRSLALARGLLALGIAPGERITVWSDNHPDWIALQFAIARIGAVLVTANTALTRTEIAYVLKQSRSSAVIAARGFRGEEYVEALASLRSDPEALPELREIILIADTSPPGMRTLEDVVRLGRPIPPAAVRARSSDVRPDDPTNVQYTSGTTGFPKGVVLSHSNIVANGFAVGELLGLTPGDRVLLQVPLFHCFGCVIGVLGTYTRGATLVALERFDPLRALEALAAERCTHLHGVPTMFHALLAHPEFRRFNLRSLRGGIMAGALCPESLMRRVIDDMGCHEMTVVYGQTEASPVITGSRTTDPVEVRCSTVGVPIPGVEARVVDPETCLDVATGDVGELWARGSNVMLGYFEMPQATADAITPEGWLRTGDLATVDEHGLFRIVGRIKDLIIRGGENVYPVEVEEAIRRHPAVHDAAVFGVTSERFGEEVAAAVIRKTGSTIDVGELRTFLEGQLAYFKRPERVLFLETFPMTPSGKIQKFKLKEMFPRS